MVRTAKRARAIFIWCAVAALVAGMLVLAVSCSPSTSGSSQAASDSSAATSDSSQAASGSSAVASDSGQTASASGDSAKPAASAASAEWSMASDCAMCHTAQHDSFENTAMRASIHKSLDCTTCHSDEAGLTKVHAKADVSKADKITRLRRTTIDQDQCFTCHGSLEDLAAKTEGIMLVDREDTAINPHALPDTATHAESITCANCHKMHSEQDAATTQSDAKEFCISCHHENAFECHTCHD